eukprot:3021636-Rhodomonas_salina.1
MGENEQKKKKKKRGKQATVVPGEGSDRLSARLEGAQVPDPEVTGVVPAREQVRHLFNRLTV